MAAIDQAFVEILPDTTKFRSLLQTQVAADVAAANLGRAGAAAERAAGSQDVLDRANRRTTSSLLGVGNAAGRLDAALLGLRTALGSAAVIGLGAGALAAIAFGKAIRASIDAFSDFEQELNVFQATTGATADEMERVQEAARALGEDIRLPAVSAADAATAMTELARAGLSVEDAIAGAEGVLQLATAAQITNAQASELAANALNSFGLEGEDAIRVADALANAANAAQGSISDFGLALQQSSAVARQVGLSLEDTTALLTEFAQAGLRGSDAGTSLRVALLRLVAPTEEASNLIRSLGIEIRDAQGNVRPDVFVQFGEATENLGPALRDAAAAAIFGQDAIRAVAIAAREGREGLQAAQAAIAQQGTAAELAAARTKGFAGQAQALQSNMETLGITIGQVVAGPLAILISGLNDVVTAANRASDAIRDMFDVGARGLLPFSLGREADDAATGLARLREELEKSQDLLQRNLLSGLDVGTFEVGVTQATDNLREGIRAALVEAQALRRTFEEEGADTTFLDAQIASLKRELESLRTDAGLVTVIDPFAKQIERARDLLEQLGLPEAKILAQLRRIRAGLVETFQRRQQPGFQAAQFAETLQQSIQFLKRGGESLSDELREVTLRTIRDTIDKLKALGPPGEAALKRIGGRLMLALGDGITAEEQQVINSARQALANVIEQGNEQVADAIRSARDTIRSEGEALSQSIAELIDAGPIGRRIEEINDQLDALQERVTFRDLRGNLRDAQAELRDAAAGVVLGFQPNAQQIQAQKEFLDPLRDNVADAKDEIKAFNLEETRDELEKTRDQAQKTAETGIENLIEAFLQGKKSADQLNQELSKRLGPSLDLIKRKNLGLALESNFLRQVQQLRSDIRDIAASVTSVSDIEPGQVGAAQASRAESVAAARQNLAQAIADATKPEHTGTNVTNRLLRDIKALLEGRGGPRTRPGAGQITDASDRQ